MHQLICFFFIINIPCSISSSLRGFKDLNNRKEQQFNAYGNKSDKHEHSENKQRHYFRYIEDVGKGGAFRSMTLKLENFIARTNSFKRRLYLDETSTDDIFLHEEQSNPNVTDCGENFDIDENNITRFKILCHNETIINGTDAPFQEPISQDSVLYSGIPPEDEDGRVGFSVPPELMEIWEGP